MANRRMLSKSISTSRRLAKVSNDAALLFTWLIPHCDDGGNMDADPMIVKGTVMPIRDISIDQVAQCLEELEKAGLIAFYANDANEVFLHIDKWLNHQTLRSDRPFLKYPKYDGKPLVNQAATNGNHKLREEKLSKAKRREGKSGVASQRPRPSTPSGEKFDPEEVAQAYVAMWNQVHGTKYSAWKPIVKNLTYWLEQYEPKEVMQAISNLKTDEFWKNKMTPVMMLRQRNPRGEEVDYIGELIHNKRGAGEARQKARIII